MKTTTKQIVINALLLAVGFLLHYVTPAIGIPMQIDFSLITMILIINLNKSSFSTCLASGVATGIFSGMTTKFPLGLVPNIIDKIVTTLVVYFLIKLLDKTSLQSKIKTAVAYAAGTLVSGITFLASALLLVGLPAPISLLFVTIVIPATIVNTIAGLIINAICIKYRRREKMNDKEMKDAIAKLADATDRLDKVADRLSETVNKMISYCTILTILMFATFVIAIIF